VTGGPEEDPTVDLAAILRSERVLSELSERRGPDDAEEPLSLLAALAADVDDAPDGVGELGDLPAETLPDGIGAARPVRGRRWVAAAIGLAAAVVGTTGVAAASPHGFPPVSTLFGQPSPSSSATVGAERTETETPATAAPTTLPAYPGPGRTPDDPATKRSTPSGSPPIVVLPPAYRTTPSPSPHSASARPSPTPSDGTGRASSRTASPSADATPSEDRSRTARPLDRLGREIDRLARPSDGP
jgi:hypothetical protein